MSAFALYNDIAQHAIDLLEIRINDGWLPNGDVVNTDIRKLSKTDLSGYGQVHLFAGIGGFPLAARMAGAPDDLPFFSAGFPCQPFSNAGFRGGTEDSRYLWPQTLAALKRHRPAFAILENVAGLVSMGFPAQRTLVGLQAYPDKVSDYNYVEEKPGVLDQICEDLDEAGYSVAPIIIPALAVGAHHQRARIWIIAYERSGARLKQWRDGFPNTNGLREQQPTQSGEGVRVGSFVSGQVVADASGEISRGLRGRKEAEYTEPGVSSRDGHRAYWQRNTSFERHCEWGAEPRVGRVVAGLSGRVDRIIGLGNAIVPQVAAEIIRTLLVAYNIPIVQHFKKE